MCKVYCLFYLLTMVSRKQSSLQSLFSPNIQYCKQVSSFKQGHCFLSSINTINCCYDTNIPIYQTLAQQKIKLYLLGNTFHSTLYGKIDAYNLKMLCNTKTARSMQKSKSDNISDLKVSIDSHSTHQPKEENTNIKNAKYL